MKGILQSRRAKTPATPGDPDEAAAFWISRKQLGTFSAQEETTFREWLTHPENAAAFEATQTAVDIAGSLAGHPDIVAMREAALAMVPAPTKSNWRQWTIAAAVAAIVAITGTLLMFSRTPEYPSDPSVAKIVAQDIPDIPPGSGPPRTLQPTPAVYATQKGRHRTVSLDDGSSIALDTATTVQVAFSESKREVALLQGQAFFHVAKDKHRPFVVTARDRRITAVGTAFDVRIDQARVRVALIEGRVVVDPVRPTGIAWLVPALATQTLEAGQELVATSSGESSVNTADIERSTEWQQDQVVFRDDTLEGAVAEMNRYSESPIVISDPKIAGLRISGVFGASRQDNFLAAVTTYYPLSAQHQPSGAVTLSWRRSEQ